MHKVDGDLFLTDEQKIDCQREVQRTVATELVEARLNESVSISFYLTSIYDHSVFEAFSKVVQKLLPQLPTLENLLNILIANCAMEKSFLFDVVSKIYIATDSNPVDMASYELCSDMIDVVIDVSCIYGSRGDQRASGLLAADADAPDDGGTPARLRSPTAAESAAAAARDAGEFDAGAAGDGRADDAPDGADASAYDAESASMIRLSNGMVLYLREVNSYLALVCLLRADNMKRRGLIDYNIGCFKAALTKVFESSRATSLER